jgi:hypothetical protein
LPLLIRVDLVPGGDLRRSREIARAWIQNDGTGTETKGNYDVLLRCQGVEPLEGKARDVRRRRNVWWFLHELMAHFDYRGARDPGGALDASPDPT